MLAIIMWAKLATLGRACEIELVGVVLSRNLIGLSDLTTLPMKL